LVILGVSITFVASRGADTSIMESIDLKNAGLKATVPRLRILQILEQSQTRHVSAEDVYKALLNNGEDIGLATVYRVLTQFEAAGLVTRLNFDTGHSVFEINEGGHHDHMVCVETGRVIEFKNNEIESLQKQIAEAHGYVLEDHNLVLYVRPKQTP
jgi:Fur family ferric uptake transcriptional regulator